ncbi:MAG: SET domain-containing protein [Roseibacillus sp.]|jgi:SET domain-containing protein|nr:SET domain-containing protein [Roseibacillus sp.]MDP6209454.1 SET domain-containing protein [Roseibacillus sp.]MDP7105558.1 SET domain-containing protein [Roseibacillus sp.]MDP7307706.1 SET domain-containing protein [Roseibacillus sp.]MDP7495557.1 SET domain-containing protein [Roseibacillus sp.]|tara:strand:+ start:13773 stop:14141 length:369 start_codon:yes stop_codon:yes gene_type:complete
MNDRSDCFQVGENAHSERATYARFAFASGELVYTVRGEATPKRTRDSIEVGPDQHVNDAYALYLNHSFTPNLRLEERRMFALRDITVGEELTFNYLDTESGIASPFVCHDTGRPVDSKACTG